MQVREQERSLLAGCASQALVSADFHLGLANESHRRKIRGRGKGKGQGISPPLSDSGSVSLGLSLSRGSPSQWIGLPWFQVPPRNPGCWASVTYLPQASCCSNIQVPHRSLPVGLSALSSPGNQFPLLSFHCSQYLESCFIFLLQAKGYAIRALNVCIK